MIWKKRKELVMDCFTYVEDVYKNYPIQPLRNAFPKWWKDLPNYNNTFENNMKYCPGIINLYKTGFCIPIWSDMNICIENQSIKSITTTDNFTKYSIHNELQYKNFIKNKNCYSHLKINSPWLINFKKEKYFFVSSAFWNGVGINDLSEIHIVPGITEFNISLVANINMFVNTEKNKQILIKKNQILSYYTPLFEEKIKIKNHLVSEKEYIKLYANTKSSLFIRKKMQRAMKLK